MTGFILWVCGCKLINNFYYKQHFSLHFSQKEVFTRILIKHLSINENPTPAGVAQKTGTQFL